MDSREQFEKEIAKENNLEGAVAGYPEEWFSKWLETKLKQEKQNTLKIIRKSEVKYIKDFKEACLKLNAKGSYEDFIVGHVMEAYKKLKQKLQENWKGKSIADEIKKIRKEKPTKQFMNWSDKEK